MWREENERQGLGGEGRDDPGIKTNKEINKINKWDLIKQKSYYLPKNTKI